MFIDRFRSYGVTTLFFFLILGFQVFINSFLDLPLIGLLYPSAFLTAYFLGVGPAILFVTLSVFGATQVFAPPFGPKPLGLADVVRLGLFAITSVGMAFFIQKGRKSRRELDALEERFHRATSAVNLGIWYSDIPTGKIIWDKHARKHLWMDESVEGNMENFIARIHPEDREKVQSLAMEAIIQNKTYDASYRTVNPADPTEVKYIRAMGWVDYGKDGNPLRFDGICFDQTEIQTISAKNARLFEEARQAVKVRDEFLSISSHELKTPLTSLEMQLQLFSHILENDPGPLPEDRLKKIVEVSQRQMRRLNSLVEDLLDASRITNGKLTLKFEATDLSQLVLEVHDRYEPLLKKNSCSLDLSLPEKIMASVDRLRFEQVIVNLLNNAMNHAPQSRVRVALKEEDGAIHLNVTDDGPGIRPEDQERIFHRFERVSSWEGKGLGLGLYIVQHIVNAHDGSIALKSDVGKGADFAIRIPKR